LSISIGAKIAKAERETKFILFVRGDSYLSTSEARAKIARTFVKTAKWG
jgi:hypothetical protein